jgi:hypothetical protein
MTVSSRKKSRVFTTAMWDRWRADRLPDAGAQRRRQDIEAWRKRFGREMDNAVSWRIS